MERRRKDRRRGECAGPSPPLTISTAAVTVVLVDIERETAA